MEKRYCSETVYPKDRWGSFHGHRCKRMAKIERAGIPYCTTHDPEEKKNREVQLQKKWAAESDARMDKWKREIALGNLSKGISTEELGDYELVRKKN